MKKALFLDRDGVVNVEKNYLHTIKDFEFIDGVFVALQYLQNTLGYAIFIVTNQSGIARGYYTKEQFLDLTRWMVEEFAKHGVVITDVSYCPHGPNEACLCRKPSPYMIQQLAQKYGVDLRQSWMIGDKFIDIQAALRAGIAQQHTIQVRSGHAFDEALSPARYILDSIKEVPKIISNL